MKLDNYLKTILLTPDVVYDTTVGEFNSENFMEVFRDYEKLENISAENVLDSGGRISFVGVSNSLFEYITTGILSNEGRIKLLSNMHISEEKKNVILCLSFTQFSEYVSKYKAVIKLQRDQLLRDANALSDELFKLTKINFEPKTEASKND